MAVVAFTAFGVTQQICRTIAPVVKYAIPSAVVGVWGVDKKRVLVSSLHI